MSATRTRAAIGAAVLVGLAIVVALKLVVVLDVSAFMFEDGASIATKLSKQLANSEVSRTLVLLVEGPDRERGLAGARALEARLRADPAILERLESIEGGPSSKSEEALWMLYHPRVTSFVATSSAGVAAALSDEGLDAALGRLVERLRSPMSTLLARVAPSDPLLVIPSLFERLAENQRGGVQLVDGRYLSKDGRRGVLFLRTIAPALSGAEQAPLLAAIDATFADLERTEPDLELQVGGLHRFAVRIERSIRADIQRVSILSMVGLLVLFTFVFRSLRVVASTLLIVAAGTIVGLAATLLVFGRIHGLTLAFGAALIGVSIDYSVHFFVHHTLAHAPPRRTFARIAPGLILGALTTVAGFGGLARSGLPGLEQVSVFASAGIAAALFATWLFLPELVATTPHRATSQVAAAWLRVRVRRLAQVRRGLWILPLAALVAIAIGAPRARWSDDVASLTYLDPELVAEEEEVRGQVAPFEQRRFVIARGESIEAALQVDDRIAAALEEAQAARELEGFRSIAAMLPSARTQREVDAAVRSAPDLAARLAAAAKAHGFRPDAFDAFVDRLAEPPPPPLTYAALDASPIAPLVRSSHLDLGDEQGVLTFLVGVASPEALEARIDAIEGAEWFDQQTLYRDVNQGYRARTVEGLSIGLLVVIALVALRYRDGRATVAALAPALLAVGLTIAALGALDLPLNLVALTALLMVFSMGVDYGVFLAEVREADDESLEGTLLAVVIAWASTLLGFGLLALSQHPAMRTIGVTACIGLTSALLLAPTALILFHRGER